MKQRLFPLRPVDIFLGMLSIINLVWGSSEVLQDLRKVRSIGALDIGMVGVGLFGLALMFFTRSDPAEKGVGDYSRTIDKISRMVNDLKSLNEFLESERVKISEAESAVRHLQQEKASLEPVVTTNRETVAAILSAYSARTARAAWKERLIGVVLGITASIIASALYDYLKK